ncbi:MAG: Ig-like domain-containing protein, partial [Candidatus Limnocylindria bacterium]
MRSIRTSSAALAATFESLGSLLSSHRGATRVSLAALSFTVVIAFSHQAPTQAGPEAAPITPEPLLPHSIGIGVATDASVTIPFDSPMDPASVEAELQVLPVQNVELAWNEDRTALEISADRLWRADERYLIVLGDGALDRDGNPSRTTRRFAFSTELAPSVSDFQVRLANADLLVDTDADPRLEMETSIAPPGTVSPDATAIGVSTTSSITVSFSDRMDTADVEDTFVITPQVEGEISWWQGNLIFTPSERLEAGARYTISVIGAHDIAGNELGGKGNFSFHVRPGAQLTKTLPERDAGDADPATVELWFSQPMEVDATNEAFALTDTTTGALVGGNLSWNDAGTQLTYVPDDAFAGDRTFEVAIGDGARDTDGNAFT